MAGAGLGGVTSRRNAGIPDISLDVGVDDAVEGAVLSPAAEAIWIVIPIGLDTVENTQRLSERNTNCRIFWRIAWILRRGRS